jgi:hypothetical protein
MINTADSGLIKGAHAETTGEEESESPNSTLHNSACGVSFARCLNELRRMSRTNPFQRNPCEAGFLIKLQFRIIAEVHGTVFG